MTFQSTYHIVPTTTFASGTDTINGATGATGVALAANAITIYFCMQAGKWLTSRPSRFRPAISRHWWKSSMTGSLDKPKMLSRANVPRPVRRAGARAVDG
jgi:hypothetical protein